MIQRIRTKAAAVVVAALAFTIAGFAFAAPPAAAEGNGVQTMEFAYVQANDSWLTDLATCPDIMPSILVVNIDNGHSNSVSDYDAVTPDIMACGPTTVLGYVTTMDVWDEDSDSNTTEMRTQAQVGSDVQKWTSPYTTGRDNALQMVDGIFLDQAPADCGTSGANVTQMDLYVDSIESHFSLWSYGDPLIAANVGAPVRDCHPGWESLGGDVPDLYGTFEGTPTAYASFLGNTSDGSTYYSGYPYFDKFFHIVYDADESEAEQATLDADTRHAKYVGTTDDTLSNPWDTRSSYADNAIHHARHNRGLVLDDGTDVQRIMSGSDIYTLQIPLNSGDFSGLIYDLAERECGVAPTDSEWGDVGSMEATVTGNSSNYAWSFDYDPLDSTFVDCMFRQIQDNSGNSDPNEPMGRICNDYVTGTTLTDYDCSNPDDSETENENEDASEFLRDALAQSSDVERLLIAVRDQDVQDSNDGSGQFCYSVQFKRCLPMHPFTGNPGPPNFIIINNPGNSTELALNDGSTVAYSLVGLGGLPNP